MITPSFIRGTNSLQAIQCIASAHHLAFPNHPGDTKHVLIMQDFSKVRVTSHHHVTSDQITLDRDHDHVEYIFVPSKMPLHMEGPYIHIQHAVFQPQPMPILYSLCVLTHLALRSQPMRILHKLCTCTHAATRPNDRHEHDRTNERTPDHKMCRLSTLPHSPTCHIGATSVHCLATLPVTLVCVSTLLRFPQQSNVIWRTFPVCKIPVNCLSQRTHRYGPLSLLLKQQRLSYMYPSPFIHLLSCVHILSCMHASSFVSTIAQTI
jgi:hypothetical protein